MPKRTYSGQLTQNEQIDQNTSNIATDNANLDLALAALNGDITLVIAPTTVAGVATAAGWTRDVTLTLVDSSSNTHTWLTQDFATSAAIGDTSTAGTASIASTTVSFTAGVASITVTGDAAAWIASETDTLTISNLTILGYTVTGGTSVETFA